MTLGGIIFSGLQVLYYKIKSKCLETKAVKEAMVPMTTIKEEVVDRTQNFKQDLQLEEFEHKDVIRKF